MSIEMHSRVPAQTTDTARWIAMSRTELVAMLFIVVTANAIVPNIVNGITTDGLTYALANTFEISAIVWLAIFVILRYLLVASYIPIQSKDRIIAPLMLVGCLLPLGPANWIVLTCFGLYLILSSKADVMFRRAGWVMLAITVPMFWSRRLFNFFSEFFLAIDAELVSSITRTERISNLVPLPSGGGYLQIAAPCSSMANVSLAILCWTLFSQTSGVRWEPRNILWCGLACLSVVAINVSRISLIGFYPTQYELLHGPVGSTVVSWMTIVSVLIVSYCGVRRGRLKIV